jgi:hypothetical protein
VIERKNLGIALELEMRGLVSSKIKSAIPLSFEGERVRGERMEKVDINLKTGKNLKIFSERLTGKVLTGVVECWTGKG